MVPLEGSLQAEELGGGEGRPDALGLPGEGPVEEQTVLVHVGTCRETEAASREANGRSACDAARSRTCWWGYLAFSSR